MRFLEILKTIRNKFIRKNPQTQPEDTQSTPEETRVPEKAKIMATATIQPNKKEDEEERLIRRYRAYAYHHKKRRIRKKYLKRLLEISPMDRMVHFMQETGCTAEELVNYLYRENEMKLLKKKSWAGNGIIWIAGRGEGFDEKAEYRDLCRRKPMRCNGIQNAFGEREFDSWNKNGKYTRKNIRRRDDFSTYND